MSRLTADCLFLFCVAPLVGQLGEHHTDKSIEDVQRLKKVVEAVDRLADDPTTLTKQELKPYIFEYYCAAHKLLSLTLPS